MNQLDRTVGYLPASAFTRTRRLIMEDDGFYYKTRENGVVGPFSTEATASYELNQFIMAIEIENDLRSQNFGNFA
jgi:hypothetical protein